MEEQVERGGGKQKGVEAWRTRSNCGRRGKEQRRADREDRKP